MRSRLTEFYSNDFITIVSNVFFNSIRMIVYTDTAVHIACLCLLFTAGKNRILTLRFFFEQFGIEILLSATSYGSVSILLVLKIDKLLVVEK